MFCLFMYYRFPISFVLVFLACGGRGTERYYRPQAALSKSFLPICAKYLFIAVFLRRGAGYNGNHDTKYCQRF